MTSTPPSQGRRRWWIVAIAFLALGLVALAVWSWANHQARASISSADIKTRYREVLEEAEDYAKNSNDYFSGSRLFPKDDKLADLIKREQSIVSCEITQEGRGGLSAKGWTNRPVKHYWRGPHLDLGKEMEYPDEEDVQIWNSDAGELVIYKKPYLNSAGRRAWVVLKFLRGSGMP